MARKLLAAGHANHVNHCFDYSNVHAQPISRRLFHKAAGVSA
jgi:hypothetical protein